MASSWRIGNVPSFGPDSGLSGISAINANDVWAVGTKGPAVFSEHLAGGVWSIVPVPNPPGPGVGSFLYGVCAIAAGEVWAVGNYYSLAGFRPGVWRWNVTSWKVEVCPYPGEYNCLLAVSGVKPDDLWAVGTYRSQSQPFTRNLIVRRDGKNWAVVRAPQVRKGHNALCGVAVVNSHDVWAVGFVKIPSTGGTNAIALHWNGNSWRSVTLPLSQQRNHGLYGVAALKSNDVWAVGSLDTQAQQLPLILHWDGSHWTEIAAETNSNSMWLSSVSAASRDDALTVGTEFKAGRPHGLIQHWDGLAWSIQDHPNVNVPPTAYLAGNQGFSAVTMLRGGGPAWVAGSFVNAAGSGEPLVEFKN